MLGLGPPRARARGHTRPAKSFAINKRFAINKSFAINKRFAINKSFAVKTRAEGGEDDVTATRRTGSIGRWLDCARGFRTGSCSRRADRGQSLVPGRAVPRGI